VKVAVVSVRVMQHALHLEVHVVAVRDLRLRQALFMVLAAVQGGADAWPAAVHGQPVLIQVLLMRGVEMAVVEVVGVIPVRDRTVAAVRAVSVGMLAVLSTGVRHSPPSMLARGSRSVKAP
jgi:hypothetical protein